MIKLPRTLHLEGSRMPPGKVDPEAVEFAKLKGQFLVVEEKLDGSGASIFFDNIGEIHVWHRGTEVKNGEFKELYVWATAHIDELFDILTDRYILFGEWMKRKHHIFYDRLPSYYLESDVYDQQNGIWLSTSAREKLFQDKELIRHVPILDRGKFHKISELTSLIARSRFQSEHWPEQLWRQCELSGLDLQKLLHHTDKSNLMEGLYIKHEDDERVLGRYKYVRYEFVNNIVNPGVHWKDVDPVDNIRHG